MHNRDGTTRTTDPIKVLIVDDSALVRQLLGKMLDDDPDIEVVGTAMDAYSARDKIKRYNPDVLTLDIEMPRMNGIVFLSNLMRLHPMPVIMIATLTESNADVTLKALELGAVDFVAKPRSDLAHTLEECELEIIAKIKAAANVKLTTLLRQANNSGSRNTTSTRQPIEGNSVLGKHVFPQESLVAIGASTGGTEAIKEILQSMPTDGPGIVVAQHIPAAYCGSFTKRMDRLSEIEVALAADGQAVLPGHAYIAPGDRHLSVIRQGTRYVCQLGDGPPVNRYKPSVDVLFRSVAEVAGSNGIGVLLTGMGEDGAAGLKQMRDSGAMTIAQDRNSSVVWGMPGAAVKLGAVDQVLPLNSVSRAILLNW
jgi:two-component system chemotaxis response regulator CheB